LAKSEIKNIIGFLILYSVGSGSVE